MTAVDATFAGSDAPAGVAGARLRVEDLSVRFHTADGPVPAVDHVSLELRAGEVHGIVGESGCGKSTFLRSILELLPGRTTTVTGRSELVEDDEARPPVPGRDVGMIFQDPSTALNPVITVGRQLVDGARRHLGLSRAAAKERAVALLARVGVPDPAQRMRAYPHELSGGLRQRVMIAVALVSEPRFLLCDEPTTALDVTVQDQVLGLVDVVRRERGLGVLFVSHDLAVVASLCSTVSVMYAGRVVERGPTTEVFAAPLHPYTEALLASVPDVHGDRRAIAGIAGAPPDLAELPPGCAFAPRCAYAQDVCTTKVPETRVASPSRSHACLQPEAVGR